MQTLIKGPQGTLELSRGKAFQAKYKTRTPLDTSTEATITFYDHAGNILATIDGQIQGREVLFRGFPDEIDEVPAGSPWEFSITNPELGEPELHSTGEVVRWEARFPLEEIPASETLAQLYQDNFNRTFLGSRWLKVRGAVKIWPHGSGANALGANNIFYTKSAARWYKALNGDDVTIEVALVNGGAGDSRVCFASNQAMTSWIGFESSVGTLDNRWRIVTGTSPTETVERDVDNEVTADGDVATVKFNSLTKTVQVFKNIDTEPILSWTDIGGEMPIGPGFRYLGVSFSASLVSAGTQFSAFSARDGI